MSVQNANIRLMLVALGLAIVPLGCESPDPDAGVPEDVVSMDESTQMRTELSDRWQELQTRVTELQAKATADGIENEWDSTIERINMEAAQLRTQLDEFQGSSRVAWNEFEARIESGFDRLEAELDQAAEQLE